MRMQEAMNQALALSKADDCIVIGEDSSSLNVRWANNTSTTNGISASQELFIISIINKKVGVAGSSYLNPDSISQLVLASEAAAQHNEPAEDYMPLVDGQSVPSDWDSEPIPADPSILDGLAGELSKLFEKAKQNEVKLFGYADHSSTTLYLANSAGLCRKHRQLEGKFELNAKSLDFKRTAWLGQATPDFSDLDLPKMYQQLSQKLDWAKTPIALEAGHYDTILESSPVADLLIYAYWTASARDADEGRTVFSKPGGGSRLGEQLFESGISLYSDPHEPGFEVRPFEVTVGTDSYSSVFDNGLNLAKNDWIKEGKLSNLITPRFWAEKTEKRPASYVHNLIFPSDGPELEEIIAQTKRGLLVTCLWYIREVDPQKLLLTGLTRDGVYLIEDGQVKGVVNNFRFNMSPLDVLKQAKVIGRSQATLAREWGDYFSFAKMPPILVSDFNMSSVSQAN
jgi:predicted Zn-dependent protease